MIELTGKTLTIEQVVSVASGNDQLGPLPNAVCQHMQTSHEWVRSSIEQGRIIYGINTGFGPLAATTIGSDEASLLSRNLILACLVGVGPPLSVELARAMMIIRANTLATGYSGIRPVIVNTLIEMLNKGVTPLIPCKGSLGASGDLAPLAHLAVVLTRDDGVENGGFSGKAWFKDELLDGAEAMRRADIARVVPLAKEGLALTNGTAFMVAFASLAIHKAERLLAHAEIAAALSIEALTGLTSAFHPALQRASGMNGQQASAARILQLVEGSKLVNSSPDRIQDAYSIRCIPQVLGPIRNILAFIRDNISAVLNGASDNPLIIKDDDDAFQSISGGNFHGQGPAMWLDFLGIATAEIGSIAERRIFRLVTPELSNGLPSMLVKSPGLNSGMMMPQYTAAALVSDNKTLAHPDSVDSIPSSGNQEDYVSMGANAARHALEIVENVQHIVAIEFLTAAQGVDLRSNGPDRLGQATRAAYDIVRRQVTTLESDRALSPSIQAIDEIIDSGTLLERVNASLEQRNGTIE